jgi:hypothetical protein
MKHLCVNKYSFNIIGCMHTIAICLYCIINLDYKVEGKNTI